MSTEPVWQPCPFCGGTEIEPVVVSQLRPAYVGRCMACEAQGPEAVVGSDWDAGLRMAVERWNRRAVPKGADHA